MLRSRQSDAANFMDIGRISAAIKRKVIELVEKGLSSGAAVVVVLWAGREDWARATQRGRAEKKIKQTRKNATAAAFIALVVYFSTFVSRSLPPSLSLSAPLSLHLSPPLFLHLSSSSSSFCVLALKAALLSARIESACRLPPTEWADPAALSALLQRSFTLHRGRRNATPGCNRRSLPACLPDCVWPRFRLAFYFRCC